MMMHTFTTTPRIVNKTSLLCLPSEVSAVLPSRGLVMSEGTVDGRAFRAPVEPDGRGGHWLNLRKTFGDAANFGTEPVVVTLSASSDWTEPTVPRDIAEAIKKDPAVHAAWPTFTPLARWDWIRWVVATNNPETRAKRIDVMCSKIRGGSRSACCFNRAACTDPDVSEKNMLRF